MRNDSGIKLKLYLGLSPFLHSLQKIYKYLSLLSNSAILLKDVKHITKEIKLNEKGNYIWNF